VSESLAILFEDAHCLAVAKPAGIATQGGSSETPSLDEEVRKYLDPAAPESVYLGTVHRLDRPVSGVILWAKTPKAARRLAAQFAERTVEKEYWAIVERRLPDAGIDETWDDWLAPAAPGRFRVVDTGTTGARRAITRCRHGAPIQLPDGTAWLRLRPDTGRTHQLRVQSAHRGRPIAGDAAYGSPRAFSRGIALHARALRFRHPVLREEIGVVAPLPETWGREGVVLPEAANPAW
jgi:23S rRNA pseudouridine1911/1915/1917 synthase